MRRLKFLYSPATRKAVAKAGLTLERIDLFEGDMGCRHRFRGSLTVGPLGGVKVIELAGLGPAPFCGMLLADMGADVVVIDRPPRKEGAPSPFELGRADIARRGKRSIALDLRHPEGAQVALRLIARCDVLIEGFRPGVMERLGLGPDECLARNGRLIYGRMTGWGQRGPLSGASGHDVNYAALTGALHCGARSDGVPWAPPSLTADMPGGLMLAFGIACALAEARLSGRGQVIDAAMIDAAGLLMHGLHSLRAGMRWEGQPGTHVLDSGAPFYDVYECADGRWISFGAIEPPYYALMLEKLGLADDPLFHPQHDASCWPERKRRIAEAVRTKTRDEWSRLLEGTDACFAPVLDMAEAAMHPHNLAREAFAELDGVTQPAPAPRFSRTPATLRQGPPAGGQHSHLVLREGGFSDDEISRLQSAGTVF